MFLQNLIKIIYTLVIAIMLVILVATGLSAFYPPPQDTQVMQPCVILQKPGVNPGGCDITTSQNTYQTNMDNYHRNATLISLAITIIYVVLGVVLFYRLKKFAGGFLLGSLFTFFYTISLAAGSANTKLEFIVVLVGLLISFFVGLLLFGNKKEEVAHA